MNWNDYHNKRRNTFLRERRVKSIGDFSDADKISLAEAGATCYDPRDDTGWQTRIWLEGIHCIFNHGCCSGCDALEKCKELSL